jgi:hypothetical protein
MCVCERGFQSPTLLALVTIHPYPYLKRPARIRDVWQQPVCTQVPLSPNLLVPCDRNTVRPCPSVTAHTGTGNDNKIQTNFSYHTQQEEKAQRRVPPVGFRPNPLTKPTQSPIPIPQIFSITNRH